MSLFAAMDPPADLGNLLARMHLNSQYHFEDTPREAVRATP